MSTKVLHRSATAAVVLCALILASLGLTGSGRALAAGGFVFTNYELSSTPGVVCPGSASCYNPEGEPQIRSDAVGNFYASSENGVGNGTAAWKSTDGGKHYVTLTSPNQISSANDTGFAPGGGDTDVATAPVKNAQGLYNVYVASLSLANVTVSTSIDGGKNWSVDVTSATIPGDDREWIAADGASKVCISYHDVATFNIDVNCSTDAGATFTQLGDAIDTNHAFLINNNEIGNLVIDPNSHNVYQMLSGIANTGEVVCGEQGTCGYHVVWIGVSTDGGKTFTDHAVYANPQSTVAYGHQFVNLSVDRGGNLYAVFTDNHNLYYSFSTNHGTSWSKPAQINKSPSNTAVMPWSVAVSAGKLDVVWYGTSYYDGINPPDNYPASAQWYVYFAQNLHATTVGSAFTQVKASAVVHTGGVCESGVTCTGNRDLFDDFGVAANPQTGLASIIYTDDQYAQTGGLQPNCTSADNSTINCNHTSIATQTSGTGIK